MGSCVLIQLSSAHCFSFKTSKFIISGMKIWLDATTLPYIYLRQKHAWQYILFSVDLMLKHATVQQNGKWTSTFVFRALKALLYYKPHSHSHTHVHKRAFFYILSPLPIHRIHIMSYYALFCPPKYPKS